ncbi:hypothetical protein D1823_11080 [Ruegeria sp. AD91A]|uniref:hypothetical protein n=1 Tax=Ruegeria sp. AD91A TaxID=2293862 RepID=UPI000E4E5239|nr:hypothetical protein [Ruegeria sp. AD91A]AXT27071.1 hypothetical protein D1823_11080 [Ruegeria sp. AD91A]
MNDRTETSETSLGGLPVLPGDPVPTRLDVLGKASTENQILSRKLDLFLPTGLDTAPPTLSFDRLRDVPIRWDQVLGTIAEDPKLPASGAALRTFFESSWFGTPMAEVTQDDVTRVLENKWAFVLTPPEDPEDTPPQVFYRAADDGSQAVPVTQGSLLRHGTSGRMYLIEAAPKAIPQATAQDATGTGPTAPAPVLFTDVDSYETFWSKRAVTLHLLASSEADLAGLVSTYEEIDMRAQFIERRYAELKILKELADAKSARAEAALNSSLDDTTLLLDPDQAAQFEPLYLEAKLEPYRIDQQLRKLQEDAAAMGYVLFIGNASAVAEEVPDGSSITAEDGKLYTTRRRKASWTVREERTVLERAGNLVDETLRTLVNPFRTPKVKRVQRYKFSRESRIVTDYIPVDTGFDPMIARRFALESEGAEVFVCRETPAGYQTEDGQFLSDIMARCAADEDFRRRAVVMIPGYEQSVSVEKPIVAWHVYHHPLPAIFPTGLTRLSVNEALSYRLAWKGAELGELVSTITLAPGENREIRLTQIYEEETSTRETRTSVAELTKKNRTDISTEMEQMTQFDNELNVWGNTSGGTSETAGPPFIRSEYAAGASNTLKVFTQSLNKIARKASASVNQRTKTTVTTDSSHKISTQNSETTVIQLSNINEGRSLNLVFNRLYNRFETGLFLEDLRFSVTTGVELIAGSGLYEQRSYRLGEIRALLEDVAAAPLPFDMNAQGIEAYLSSILDLILAQLSAEYLTPPDEGTQTPRLGSAPGEEEEVLPEDAASAAAVDAAPELRALAYAARQKLRDGMTPDAPPLKGGALGADLPSALSDRIGMIEDLAATLNTTSLPVGGAGSADLLVASEGLYMDSMVGARPATEPYSEEMRAQEIRLRAARVQREQSEAQLSLAQATRIAGQARVVGGNSIIGVLLSQDGRSLVLSLSLPLSPAQWALVIAGKVESRARIDPSQRGRTMISVDLSAVSVAARNRMKKNAQLMNDVSLRDLKTEDEIFPT